MQRRLHHTSLATLFLLCLSLILQAQTKTESSQEAEELARNVEQAFMGESHEERIAAFRFLRRREPVGAIWILIQMLAEWPGPGENTAQIEAEQKDLENCFDELLSELSPEHHVPTAVRFRTGKKAQEKT